MSRYFGDSALHFKRQSRIAKSLAGRTLIAGCRTGITQCRNCRSGRASNSTDRSSVELYRLI